MLNATTLTAEQVMAVLLDPLTPASRFLAAGPRVYDGPNSAPMRIPKVDALAAIPCVDLDLEAAPGQYPETRDLPDRRLSSRIQCLAPNVSPAIQDRLG